MPSVYIKTYGCQMNERDSDQVARMFVERGYTVTEDEGEAETEAEDEDEDEDGGISWFGRLFQPTVDRDSENWRDFMVWAPISINRRS